MMLPGPKRNLNPNVEGLRESATVSINQLSNQLRAEGREIFKLGLGESPFPVAEPVVRALQDAAEQKSYLPVRGLPALREALAEHHRRDFGIDCSPDDILVGPGSKELMFLLQLTYFGDLIIPSPSWVSYAPQASIVGRGIHWVKSDFESHWLIQANDLEELCREDPDRAHLMIINYPSNPTGQTYSPTQLRELSEVARKHGVVLLSDEIYGKLHHDGAHRSVVSMYPEGTIFSDGLSKWCGAGGWRLGFFVFPPGLRWLQDAMAAVASETFTATCNPIQHAAVVAFSENPEIAEYVRNERRILKALGQALTEKLREAGARILDPLGGFYLFPDFEPVAENLHRRGIHTSAKMCTALLEDTGVATLPGSNFGRPELELTARLAYVDFDGAAALKVAREIPQGEPIDVAFLQQCCGRMLEAVDRTVDWLHQTTVS
jgi:aspartate aminotransferase